MSVYNNVYMGTNKRTRPRSVIGNVYLNAGAMVPLAERTLITVIKDGVYMWGGRRVHHMGGAKREFVLFQSSIHNKQARPVNPARWVPVR